MYFSADGEMHDQMGEANGSIPTVQPAYGRPMWAAQPSSVGKHSIIWASKASIDNGQQHDPLDESGDGKLMCLFWRSC